MSCCGAAWLREAGLSDPCFNRLNENPLLGAVDRKAADWPRANSTPSKRLQRSVAQATAIEIAAAVSGSSGHIFSSFGVGALLAACATAPTERTPAT